MPFDLDPRGAAPDRTGGRPTGVEIHLLGEVEFGSCLALQQRLVYEAGGVDDGRIVVLLAEHPNQITVGRLGSWAHITPERHKTDQGQVPVRWIGRGGGCLMHTPGQLAVYPIVRLDGHGWTVGAYLDRLQAAVAATLAERGFAIQARPGRHGVWGRGGQVAALGVAVRGGVAFHGAFINVAPSLRLLRLVDADPWEHTPMTSLAAERREPARMARVREGLIRHLPEAFGASRCHVFTGHPLLAAPRREPAARAG
jgi:lipoyl(octanoyl) transferase